MSPGETLSVDGLRTSHLEAEEARAADPEVTSLHAHVNTGLEKAQRQGGVRVGSGSGGLRVAYFGGRSFLWTVPFGRGGHLSEP